MTDILRLAEGVCLGTVPLLGLGPVEVGTPPQWHRDFVSGEYWPCSPHREIDYTDFGGGTDVRLTWELNRCHQLVWLAQAFNFSGEQRFARALLDQMESWAESNPVGQGVNWAVAMEVAIRLVNWLWALALLRTAGGLSSSVWRRVEPLLALHAHYIAGHLEIGRHPGNHYLANGAGLIYAGILLRPRPEASRWLRCGLDIILGEVPRQFYPDGGNFESSIGYHRLSLELCLTPLILAEKAGVSIPGQVRSRLRAACGFLAAYLYDGGEGPNFGDDDGGRLLRLFKRPLQDHAALLWPAYAWLGPQAPPPAGQAGRAEALWLLGEIPGDPPAAKQPPPGQMFPQTGFHRMQTKRLCLSVRTGKAGKRPGHRHNDALSFELLVSGIRCIVDSGTYLYTASRELRHQFRGTAAHNLTMLDGREIAYWAQSDGPWGQQDQAACEVLRWKSGQICSVLVAQHDGYKRLPSPVACQRSFILWADFEALFVQEDFTTDGQHNYELRLHLAPGWEVRGSLPRLLLCPCGAKQPCVELHWIEGDAGLEVETCNVSSSYGQMSPSACLNFRWSSKGNCRRRWGLRLLESTPKSGQPAPAGTLAFPEAEVFRS
ncbi:MAG: heparinase II/III family protein [Proteobacteria bacterium]|nr:heparinase II/III family protein [Pseudomonadota bacterium]